MVTYELTKDENLLVKNVINEARSCGVAVDDWFVFRKNGRLFMNYTRKDTGGRIHQIELGKYA